jgi:hypothetical protein
MERTIGVSGIEAPHIQVLDPEPRVGMQVVPRSSLGKDDGDSSLRPFGQVAPLGRRPRVRGMLDVRSLRQVLTSAGGMPPSRAKIHDSYYAKSSRASAEGRMLRPDSGR